MPKRRFRRKVFVRMITGRALSRMAEGFQLFAVVRYLFFEGQYGAGAAGTECRKGLQTGRKVLNSTIL